jgi:hypothetical protein
MMPPIKPTPKLTPVYTQQFNHSMPYGNALNLGSDFFKQPPISLRLIVDKAYEGPQFRPLV